GADRTRSGARVGGGVPEPGGAAPVPALPEPAPARSLSRHVVLGAALLDRTAGGNPPRCDPSGAFGRVRPVDRCLLPMGGAPHPAPGTRADHRLHLLPPPPRPLPPPLG